MNDQHAFCQYEGLCLEDNIDNFSSQYIYLDFFFILIILKEGKYRFLSINPSKRLSEWHKNGLNSFYNSYLHVIVYESFKQL